jgi:hypothetical protein
MLMDIVVLSDLRNWDVDPKAENNSAEGEEEIRINVSHLFSLQTSDSQKLKNERCEH